MCVCVVNTRVRPPHVNSNVLADFSLRFASIYSAPVVRARLPRLILLVVGMAMEIILLMAMRNMQAPANLTRVYMVSVADLSTISTNMMILQTAVLSRAST